MRKCPDWNVRSAFLLIDSENLGYFDVTQLYGFLKINNFNASDEELNAIIRRIEGHGTGTIDFNDLKELFQPIQVKMENIVSKNDDH